MNVVTAQLVQSGFDLIVPLVPHIFNNKLKLLFYVQSIGQFFIILIFNVYQGCHRSWKKRLRLPHTNSIQVNVWNFIYLNCGEWYEDMIDYHSCAHNLQRVCLNRGHPDNENQSEGRTETIDSNIFKSSQSNAQHKTMKSQLVRWPVMFKRRFQAPTSSTFMCLRL